jgi:FlaA1/EpsC-like NDP-sugar epimerase
MYTQGWDVFMLSPYKILDWASKLIRLKGLRIDEDIIIVLTGTRQWEQLTESLAAPEGNL